MQKTTVIQTTNDHPAQKQKTTQFRKVSLGDVKLDERARRYLLKVIDSNRLSHGPFSEQLEAAFARAHGVPHSLFCNSGTAALQLALAALRETRGWRDGDEVIVPAVTFVSTINVVLQSGLKPILVDVDPNSYTIDTARIDDALTDRTRCIIPVHLLGLPADMDEVLEIAGRRGLSVIEDSCECMFARYRGRLVGSMGDVGCFSTYVAHLLVTGIGGFVTTDDPQLNSLMSSLMNHGRDTAYTHIDDDDDVHAKNFTEVVDRRFRFNRIGYSLRCTEMEAAIGLAQLEDAASMTKARQATASYYLNELRELSDVLELPTRPDDRDHAFMVFPMAMRKGTMHSLVQHLERSGIETRPTLPLIHQPAYTGLFGDDVATQFPVADSLSRRAFYIGCHPHLTDGDRLHVVETIKRFFQQ